MNRNPNSYALHTINKNRNRDPYMSVMRSIVAPVSGYKYLFVAGLQGEIGPTGATGFTGFTGFTGATGGNGSSIIGVNTPVFFNTIGASIDSDGNLLLGAYYLSGGSSINIIGHAIWSCSGSSPSSAAISLATLSSLTLASSNPGNGTVGDLVVAIVRDTTNSITYRITALKVSSGSYNIIVEQLM